MNVIFCINQPGDILMTPSKSKVRKKALIITVIVIVIDIAAILLVRNKEILFIRNSLSEHSQDTKA